jgi:hypothetical protein
MRSLVINKYIIIIIVLVHTVCKSCICNSACWKVNIVSTFDTLVCIFTVGPTHYKTPIDIYNHIVVGKVFKDRPENCTTFDSSLKDEEFCADWNNTKGDVGNFAAHRGLGVTIKPVQVQGGSDNIGYSREVECYEPLADALIVMTISTPTTSAYRYSAIVQNEGDDDGDSMKAQDDDGDDTDDGTEECWEEIGCHNEQYDIIDMKKLFFD